MVSTKPNYPGEENNFSTKFIENVCSRHGDDEFSLCCKKLLIANLEFINIIIYFKEAGCNLFFA